MAEEQYDWTDDPMKSGEAICDTDIANECFMHLKYLKADDSDVVHKSGDTMTGRLRFDSDDGAIGVLQQGTQLDNTTAPSEQKIIPIGRCIDANNNILGDVRIVRDQSGSQVTYIMARNAMTGSAITVQLGVGVNYKGQAYTYAPPCAITNSIVTTTGISLGTNGYVKLGNGLIIQYGQLSTASAISGNSSVNTTLTFPTAFTTNQYELSILPKNITNHANSRFAWNNATQASITINCYNVGSSQIAAINMKWIAIGH